jgi:ligand-binding sensor domain-containing protein
MEYNPAKPALLPSLGVYSILRMSDNELYVGCDNGLYAWDRTTDRFSAVPWFSRIKPPGKLLTVYSLARTPDGSVWIGTYENGVYRYNPQDDSILEYHHDESDPGSLSDNLVYFIYEDRSSDVWIGTNRGLNRINSETGALTAYYYNRSNPAGISSNTLYACYEHSDGTLWFGTRNGGVCS